MIDILSPVIAIAVSRVSAPEDENHPLFGVALFEVGQYDTTEFRHRISVHVLPAGTSKGEVVEWLLKRLAADWVAIGWRLAEFIIPTLLGASEAAPPDLANAFLDALAGAVTIDAVDLADEVDPAVFEQAFARQGTPTESVSGAATAEMPTDERGKEHAVLLAKQAVAAWQVWANAQRPEDPNIDRLARDALSQWHVGDETLKIWRAEQGE